LQPEKNLVARKKYLIGKKKMSPHQEHIFLATAINFVVVTKMGLVLKQWQSIILLKRIGIIVVRFCGGLSYQVLYST